METPVASFGRSHPTPVGRVRVRLAHGSDREAVGALLARDPADVLFHDPRERAVACAVGLRDGHEAVLGVGSIALRPGEDPDLLHAEHPAVAGLLDTALRERARHPRPVAQLSPAPAPRRWPASWLTAPAGLDWAAAARRAV